jgi:hypothetical protein
MPVVSAVLGESVPTGLPNVQAADSQERPGAEVPGVAADAGGHSGQVPRLTNRWPNPKGSSPRRTPGKSQATMGCAQPWRARNQALQTATCPRQGQWCLSSSSLPCLFSGEVPVRPRRPRQLRPLFLPPPLVRCRTCGTDRDCSARAWWCGQCGCQNEAPIITLAATNARPTDRGEVLWP